MPRLDPALGHSITLAYALLFAAAAVHKLRDLPRFTAIFAAYRLLPGFLARRAAWLIPCVELGVAIGLPLSAGGRPQAVLAGAGVLIAYAAGVGLNLARGRRDLDCGCVTARSRRSIAPWMVSRNLILALVLGFAAGPWSSRPVEGADFLTVPGAVAAAALLYAAVDRLLGDVMPRTIAFRRTS
jgi:hypothetical protein